MAKKRSAAHLAQYQYRSQPTIIRQTRVVKVKQKRRRSGGSGGGLGLGAIVMANMALPVLEGLVLRFAPVAAGGGNALASPAVMTAFAASWLGADKYVKGITLVAKIKAVESVMGSGGLGNIFGPAPAAPPAAYYPPHA